LQLELAVVILNFNGSQHLRTFLPSVLEHTPYPIFVADNGSTDDSLDFLRSTYPTVQLIELPVNYGFAGGYNEALKLIDAEYYILLNSDVQVTPVWVEPLLAQLKSESDTAACQPKILDYKNPGLFEYAGASGGFIDRYAYPFCRGRIFDHCERSIGQHDDTRSVFWATGACMLVRASSFWEVGGFDSDLFAHMEEIDLCWRLRNRGYTISCAPESKVYHLGGGTLSSQSPRKTYLNFRNNLIVMYKNDRRGNFGSRFFLRLMLDGVAAIQILFTKGWHHFAAIFKAHISFYANFRSHSAKRESERLQSLQPNLTGCYERSIVWDYFWKGRKVFGALPTLAFKCQDRKK